jgi:hypothetical protein
VEGERSFARLRHPMRIADARRTTEAAFFPKIFKSARLGLDSEESHLLLRERVNEGIPAAISDTEIPSRRGGCGRVAKPST